MYRKTNQGFINIVLIVAVALLASASTYFYTKFQKEKLGATIIQTQLSDTIGTFRTNVNTSLQNLNDAISNSTSTDPGFKITSASVSGTIAIAKGGTGTSTAPTDGQVLLGSSSSTQLTYTNALPDCSTASSSKLLYTSSTKTWSCGTDYTVSTSSETWGLLGQTTLGATNASASISISARNHFRIYVFASSTGAGTRFLRFNNNQASIYANRFSSNNGADTAQTADNIFYLSGSVTSSTFSVIDVGNDSGRFKLGSVLTTIDSGLQAPVSFQNYGTWATTTQITTIALGIDANSFTSTTFIAVYGQQ